MSDDKPIKIWSRQKRRIFVDESSQYPLHIRTVLPRINNLTNVDHPDEDMRVHLTPISEDPESYERQMGAYDQTYGLMGEFGPGTPHTAPTFWSTLKGLILPTSRFNSRTQGVECTRCGEHVKASRTRPIALERNGQKIVENQCYPQCEDWSDGVSPARRN